MVASPPSARRPLSPETVQEISDWLVEQGLTGGTLAAILAEFCDRMVGRGFPIVRVHLSFSTLHPNFSAFGCTWRRQGEVIRDSYDIDAADRQRWQESPIRPLVEEGLPNIRRRLVGPEAKLDYPMLSELRDDGGTDWYANKVAFSGLDTPTSLIGIVMSWLTDHPEGFSDHDVAVIERLTLRLALVVYRVSLEQVAVNLLDTYVGRQAGQHILMGRIRRGDLERIDAVILFADLRGFTKASETTPAERLVQGLNDYLGSLTEAIEAQGGEVLKFLGDGLLAVFVLAGAAPGAMCQAALAAADRALAENRELNRDRAAAGEPVMPLDIALHQGEVLYGNVGSAKRLDFTVIGPAVNQAARIEALCEPLGEPLLLSARFAGCAGVAVRSLGTHALKGVAEPQEVFAPQSS
ncbi:MAG: adenylate/guanylate cyclase domain-containing protein [Pseudomonadota bacterium]